ncbi:serine protease snake [Manduca sexta]|uniref:trypsin n=1 Tax=Manduca sexta TaxID=7130 RepID=A0A921ZV75_MANSE|nr:serine protease snake [Manduca sexta]KAG6463577.1 hypothetical protein O3G_MSEX013954 [Manduca sexta]KAG6463578.1 hypothetical protein O3G_MSEX013954 [Manduca sexta]
MMYKCVILFFLYVLILPARCQTKAGDQCVDDYTKSVGKCSLIENCPSAKKASVGNGITPTFCAYSAFSPTLVCCLDEGSILQTAPTTQEKPPVWSDGDKSKRVSERKCDEYSRDVIHRTHYVALQASDSGVVTAPKCDYQGTGLIVGGEEASVGEFPHMAAIGWRNETGYAFQCGGSLISPKFILTAGHCIKFGGADPAIARLGDHNLDPTVNDRADHVDVPISKVIKHPDYNSPLVYNDIALMELANAVTLRTAIRPACLWTKGGFGTHTSALATGWGVTDDRSQETSKVLRKVSLSLLQNDHCNPLMKNYQTKRKWPGFISSQMCAGELRGGKDTCQGDSGAPLQVVSSDNQCIFHVVGVVSFGRYCAVKGHPGVYTRVSSYLDWIEKTVWPGE